MIVRDESTLSPGNLSRRIVQELCGIFGDATTFSRSIDIFRFARTLLSSVFHSLSLLHVPYLERKLGRRPSSNFQAQRRRSAFCKALQLIAHTKSSLIPDLSIKPSPAGHLSLTFQRCDITVVIHERRRKSNKGGYRFLNVNYPLG